MNRNLLTANEVAERLSISRAQAYKLIKHGDISKVNVRGSVRVKEEDLEQFIEENRTCSNNTPIKYQARRANGEFGDQSSQLHLSQGVSS
jgi:excisionase family DNA binding protein